jgi:hypothetical protein
MSNLQDQIKKDLITSLKAKEEGKVSVLRMLQSVIKNKEIELKKRDGLSDEEIGQLVISEVKKRNDSIESYKSGNRNDLVEKEEKEIEILKSYMPEQMSEEEVGKIVEKAINDVGAASAADFGKVMGKVMAEVKGKTDGNMVSKIVKDKLS